MKQDIITCTRCSLSETRKNAVPGEGSFNADVIFVGEAPGRNEDATGRPFVGMAGRKLDESLENSKISRKSIYITNVVKCRPPNNRVPSNVERESCADYLKWEIDIIKPKIICIMGNTALGSILDKTQITKYRGKLIKKNDTLYFVTIHPAATIYRQELGDVLNSDIVKLFHIIEQLKNNEKVKPDIEYTS